MLPLLDPVLPLLDLAQHRLDLAQHRMDPVLPLLDPAEADPVLPLQDQVIRLEALVAVPETPEALVVQAAAPQRMVALVVRTVARQRVGDQAVPVLPAVPAPRLSLGQPNQGLEAAALG